MSLRGGLCCLTSQTNLFCWERHSDVYSGLFILSLSGSFPFKAVGCSEGQDVEIQGPLVLVPSPADSCGCTYRRFHPCLSLSTVLSLWFSTRTSFHPYPYLPNILLGFQFLAYYVVVKAWIESGSSSQRHGHVDGKGKAPKE